MEVAIIIKSRQPRPHRQRLARPRHRLHRPNVMKRARVSRVVEHLQRQRETQQRSKYPAEELIIIVITSYRIEEPM